MPSVIEEVFWRVAKEYLLQFRGCHDVDEIDFDEWNNRFPVAVRANHARALTQRQERTVNAFIVELRNAFGKVEKIIRVAKGPYEPRLILGASDVFNVIWGAYFFKARDVLAAAYQELPGNVLLASGKTSARLGQWFLMAMSSEGRAICGDDQLVITKGIFIESDGARHDAHMHKEFFEFKWMLYEYLFRVIPRSVLRVAKEAARHTTGRSRRFGVKFEVDYRVRSGDPDTEKGNSVCTDLVAWYTSKLVSNMKEEGLNNAQMETNLRAQVLELGYEIDVKVTKDPTAVTFLSGGFLPVDGVYYWYPLPGKQLAKIGWSIRDLGGEMPWQDFAGTLNSFRDYSFVPFLRVYVDVVSQLVPEAYRLEPPSKRWHVGPGITPRDPSDDTWDWFTRRYSLTKSDEKEYKRQLQQIRKLPWMVNSFAVEQMMTVDMA